jgi:hypothetical protein
MKRREYILGSTDRAYQMPLAERKIIECLPGFFSPTSLLYTHKVLGVNHYHSAQSFMHLSRPFCLVNFYRKIQRENHNRTLMPTL